MGRKTTQPNYLPTRAVSREPSHHQLTYWSRLPRHLHGRTKLTPFLTRNSDLYPISWAPARQTAASAVVPLFVGALILLSVSTYRCVLSPPWIHHVQRRTHTAPPEKLKRGLPGTGVRSRPIVPEKGPNINRTDCPRARDAAMASLTVRFRRSTIPQVCGECGELRRWRIPPALRNL